VGGLLCSDLEEELRRNILRQILSGASGTVVMNAKDLKRYRRQLLEKQRELSSSKSDAQTCVPAAGGFEGDLVDQANAEAEADLQIHLHQSDGRLLRAIEDALARMRQGRYGICTICREPISAARLEAVPWTHLCRDCKEHRG
jgi:RNA polymerase-binding transcription factor